MAILSLKNISFSYGSTPVLKDISYDFEKGKIYAKSQSASLTIIYSFVSEEIIIPFRYGVT